MYNTFDVAKYEQRIEASRRRLEACREFREGDYVPTHIGAGGSFFCKLFGVNIRDYYTDIDTQIYVKYKALEWAYENLPDDRTSVGITLDHGPIVEGLVFDCEIVYPDDTSPWICRKLHDVADIEKLEVLPPEENPRVLAELERSQRFRDRALELGVNVPVGVSGLGIHPPISCATAIMEPELVYTLMAEEPKMAQVLFEKCFNAFCALKEFVDKKLYGRVRTESLGLADDNSAFVSDAMYREQVLPWNLELYRRYGKKFRSLHADGPNEHHYRTYVDIVKLNQMDIGGWSKLEPAVEIMKGKCVFSGNLNCRDFYGEFDEELKAKIRRCIKLAGPGGGYILAIGGETYAGVRVDTLIEAFRYAREVGKYPIQIEQ